MRQCPACRAGHLVERTGIANRRFLGCSQFPNCEDTARLK
ncbi:topoisomerase DNA-binding C4 zinc finger domain-containing protein [Mesorhizobium sp. M0960]